MGRKAFLAGAAAVMMLMAAGCGEKKAAVMGPDETVEAFCRAVAAGRFEEAKSLCDTVTMKGYIEKYAQAWNMLTEKDSKATAIASASLADADIMVEDIAKDGDRRIITYVIAAGDMDKKKTATVRKEDGVWKVERITDCL